MKISLTDACNALAALQDRVAQTAGQLRRARTSVAASREAAANGASPIVDGAAAAAYLAHCEEDADLALTEYRDAAPQFAYVTSLFPAANDEGFEQPTAVVLMTDKASVLCKLLAHGGLGVGEILEITRWTRDDIDSAIATAIGDSRIVKIKELNMQPVYRLSSAPFLA